MRLRDWAGTVGFGCLVAAAALLRTSVAAGVLLTAALLCALLVILDLIWHGGKRQQGPDPLRTADEAARVSTDIFQWLSDRLHLQPQPGPQSMDAYMAFGNETMSIYNERFSVRSLAVFDRLCSLGAVNENERFLVQFPTNPIGIRMVAQGLGTAAEALRTRDG